MANDKLYDSDAAHQQPRNVKISSAVRDDILAVSRSATAEVVSFNGFTDIKHRNGGVLLTDGSDYPARKRAAKYVKLNWAQMSIQYGGSVVAGNTAAFPASHGVDGAPIGGANCKADKFLALVACWDL